MAHLLIDRFGSVYNVLTAPEDELTKVSGVGTRTAQWLNKMGEMMLAFAALRDSDRVTLKNYADIMKFCRLKAEKVKRPQTYCIAMTPAGAVQAFDYMCDSTAWAQAESLKRCLDTALRLYARHMVVVEFSDDGHPMAHEDDIRYAVSFAQTLEVMNAELLDVVVLGTEEAVSFRALGHLPEPEKYKERSLLSERYLMEAEPSEEDQSGPDDMLTQLCDSLWENEDD